MFERIAAGVRFLFERTEKVDTAEPHQRPPVDPIDNLIDKILKPGDWRPRHDQHEAELRSEVLGLNADGRRAFIARSIPILRAALAKSVPGSGFADNRSYWRLSERLLEIILLQKSISHEQLLTVLDWSGQQYLYWFGISEMARVLEGYLETNPVTPEIRARIPAIVERYTAGGIRPDADRRRAIARLNKIVQGDAPQNPIVSGEAWSDRALADIQGAEQQGAWISLLNECRRVAGSTPPKKWLDQRKTEISTIGSAAFRSALLDWFPLVDRPRTVPIEDHPAYLPDPNNLIDDRNADILKGLVWLAAEFDDVEMARALGALALSAYRKAPGVGPRCVRVGNACLWALGQLTNETAVGQLALLNIKVTFGSARRLIERALIEAADRLGLPRDEIDELAVPSYGLDEGGVRREAFDGAIAEIIVVGSAAEIRWFAPDGRPLKAPPKAVKTGHAEDLKELGAVTKEIRAMLTAQRDRIDGLFLLDKRWTYPAWYERYIAHPLVGTIGRRLIWRARHGAETNAFIWHEGRFVRNDGSPVALIDDAEISLWHPLGEPIETVLAWRAWLTEHEVRQPFKQAHREVYLLTDAERTTGRYSNRYAAHIVKQHQLNALATARGWKVKLRMMVDDVFPPVTRALPAWNLRAEYWVEGAGNDYGVDTNEAGAFLYLATDQVRFYPIAASRTIGHAFGGGYGVVHGEDPATPLDLETIPPLVFSEIMRDVDLFIGVASVGNDPNWLDGGPANHHEYWNTYAFGDLTETAQIRRQLLAGLLPRLAIANRCSLGERWLVVRGDLRTYRIHLGSANILMNPDNQYLCIVPKQTVVNDGVVERIFLPFEGDSRLSIILSKALLLANDREITDPTILRQIRP